MIARVFPTKTSFTPIDEHSYYGKKATPTLLTPHYDEVHVSVTFTWDKEKGRQLMKAWKPYANTVRIGGVAIDGESNKCFISGMYLKKGVTITSRGCPNNCSFCIIKNDLIEFDDFPEGNIIQDNNILACSDNHWDKVISMLKKQKKVSFKGGLEASRITTKKAEDIRSLHVRELWLACDSDGAIEPLNKAVDILLNAGIPKSYIYCYCLIGKEEQRLRAVREMGIMPFAQLYRSPDSETKYTKEMKQYARKTSRPAITRNFFND